MGIEYELKFRATEDVLDQVRQAYPDGHREFQMETIYYDTPDNRLSARYYTLRRRMENGVSVCTLKTPAEGIGRQELETECDSIEAAIPILCAIGAPADFLNLTTEGVVPICGAKFTRTAISVVQEDCTVELALDTGILTGGNKSVPMCELEVELKDGEPAAAEQFALALAAIYGLKPESKSKFRRALALYKGE